MKKAYKDLWGTIKRTDMHIMVVLEGEEREKGTESSFKDIMAGKYQNLGKEWTFIFKKLNGLQLRYTQRNPQ